MSFAHALSFAVLSSAALLAQDRPSRPANVAGLRDAQAGPLVFGVAAPAETLRSTLAALGRLLPKEKSAELEAGFEEMPEELGFDARKAEDWLRCGLEPQGDWSLTLSAPGGFLGLPEDWRLAMPVRDSVKFDEFLTGRLTAKSPERVLQRHVNPTFVSSEELAWAFFGNRGLVLMRGGHGAGELETIMRAWIAAQGAGGTLGESKAYRLVRDRLAGDARLGFYFSPKAWQDSRTPPDAATRDAAAAESDAQPSDLREVLFAIDDQGLVAAADFAPALLAELASPAKVDVRTVAATLPRPDVLLVANVADPGRALRRWSEARLAFGGTSGGFLPLDEAAPQVGELAGAGLAIWLPPRDGTDNVHGLAFLQGSDEASAKQVYARLAERLRVAASESGGAGIEAMPAPTGIEGVRRIEGAAEFVARRGTVVYLGDAVEALEAQFTGGTVVPTDLLGDAAIEARLDLAAIARRIEPGLTTLRGHLHLRADVVSEHLVVALRHVGDPAHEPFLAELVALLMFLDVG